MMLHKGKLFGIILAYSVMLLMAGCSQQKTPPVVPSVAPPTGGLKVPGPPPPTPITNPPANGTPSAPGSTTK